eukprot:16294112-Heterocapsa_arctica.AAC.1
MKSMRCSVLVVPVVSAHVWPSPWFMMSVAGAARLPCKSSSWKREPLWSSICAYPWAPTDE